MWKEAPEILMLLAGTSPLRGKKQWGTVTSPCWFSSAFWETRVLTAGNVMLDTAATIPAAHIILQWQVRLWSGGRQPSERAVQSTSGKSTKYFLLSYIKLYLFFFLFEKNFFKPRTLQHTIVLILITSWAGKVSFLYAYLSKYVFFLLVYLLPSLNASSMKFKSISCFCKSTFFSTIFPFFLYFQRLASILPIGCSSFLHSIKCCIQPTEKNGDLEFRMASCRLPSLFPLDLCLNEEPYVPYVCISISVSVSKVQGQLS